MFLYYVKTSKYSANLSVVQSSGAAMILGASCEFDRMHNAEIIERPTDNEELPLVCIQILVIITG